jgi:hypothetical protein
MAGGACRAGGFDVRRDIDAPRSFEFQRQGHGVARDERLAKVDEHDVEAARGQHDLAVGRDVDACDGAHPHQIALHRHRMQFDRRCRRRRNAKQAIGRAAAIADREVRAARARPGRRGSRVGMLDRQIAEGGVGRRDGDGEEREHPGDERAQ